MSKKTSWPIVLHGSAKLKTRWSLMGIKCNSMRTVVERKLIIKEHLAKSTLKTRTVVERKLIINEHLAKNMLRTRTEHVQDEDKVDNEDTHVNIVDCILQRKHQLT